MTESLEMERGVRPGLVSGLVVNADPAIVFGRDVAGDYLGPARALSRHLRNRRVYFLVADPLDLDDAAGLQALADTYFTYSAAYPEHVLIYLCATASDVERTTQRGVRCALVDANVFADDTAFSIDPAAEKSFDAICNARFTRASRQHLCGQIDSLKILYYLENDLDLAYAAATRSALPRAVYCNGAPGEPYRWLDGREVAAALNTCRVGLCLSSRGARNRACVEYLLCGLPVVSTADGAARHDYLDDEFCLTVDPEPEAIARAVRDLIAARIDPRYVRERALHRLRDQRDAFAKLVQGIFDREKTGRRFRADWRKLAADDRAGRACEPEAFLATAGLR